MKKLLFIISIVFLSIGTAYAYQYKPYSFPFIGKWNPSQDPLLLGEYGLQDIQNVRRSGKRLEGVKGHSVINVDEISGDSSYPLPRNGFNFSKDDPVIENHILINSYNEAETASKIYQNKVIVPNSGDFESTELHTSASNATITRFSQSPNGNVAAGNSKEALIWGGDEMKIAGFFIYVPGQTPADNWQQVLDNNSDTYVGLGGVTRFYIVANRRINKIKAYVKTANTTAATVGVSAYRLSSQGFTAVASASDGTSSGGIPLASTGTVSWTFSTDDRTTFIDDTDILGYAYEFTYSAALSAETKLYHITCGESAFRPIEDIWDGTLIPPARVWYTTASGTTDFTTECQEDLYLSYADLETWSAANNSLVIGFTQKMRGIALKFVSSKINANASSVTAYFWASSAWSGVTGLYDGTKNGTATFGNNEGWIHWIPTEETTVDNIETKRNYKSNELFYYYKINVSANLTSNVRLFYVEGIPAQPAKYTTKLTPGKPAFTALYQKRLFLFEGNKATYSAIDSSEVFNGDDTGTIRFSGEQKITSAGVIYNVFLSTGYEQLIVTKASETLRLHGNGPENWSQEQIDSNLGNVAPLSFAACNVSDIGENTRRNVAIWQSSRGFVKCDGATVQPILDEDGSDPLGIYFNPLSDVGISRHRIDDTVGWYDPQTDEYHALISSGAEVRDQWGGSDTWHDSPTNDWGIDRENSINTHNMELVYNLKYNEWTKIYREDAAGARPLQVGFQVNDNEGKVYTYGASDNGIMYRLEYGKTWAGIPIEQYIHTKDIMLDDVNSLEKFTTITRIRMMFETKNAISGETIVVTHYGDGVESVSGVSNQKTIEDISMADAKGRNSQDVALGQALKHSIRLDCSTFSVDHGMSPLGMLLMYESHDRWEQ